MARGLMTRLGATGSSAGAGRSVEASIVAHLRDLLNTRQGDSSSVPDFGVPDFTDYLHNFPGGLSELQLALQRAITTFEPRLTQVNVLPVEIDTASLTLHFEVRARLASAPDVVTRFSTRVTRAGRVAVER